MANPLRPLATLGFAILVIWFLAGPKMGEPRRGTTLAGATPSADRNEPQSKTDQDPRLEDQTEPDDPTPPAPGSDPSFPAPGTADDAGPGVLAKVICEHFRSHPATADRIRFLKNLEAGTPTQRQLPEEPVDLFIDFKNRTLRAGYEVFVEAAGPMSVEEEWKLGRKLHEELLTTVEIDAEASERLSRLAAPILSPRIRTKDMPFVFTVVDKDEINACALLGGHVYVYSGLLKTLEDDAELQFVLAHEIAHIELGHCAEAQMAGIAAERAIGSFARLPADLAQKLVMLGYSEDNEFDADAWAYRRLRANGVSAADALRFFHILLQHEQSQRAYAPAPSERSQGRIRLPWMPALTRDGFAKRMP
jgi:Zn-dependent protease with chaperone function